MNGTGENAKESIKKKQLKAGKRGSPGGKKERELPHYRWEGEGASREGLGGKKRATTARAKEPTIGWGEFGPLARNKNQGGKGPFGAKVSSLRTTGDKKANLPKKNGGLPRTTRGCWRSRKNR